jgi:hypothetical protein
MQVRGVTLRAYIQWLTRESLLAEVLTRVPPSTARLLKDPPRADVWVEGREVLNVVTAIDTLYGLDGVRRFARETLDQQIVPTHRPVLIGLLRMFGASPVTLFKRMNLLVRWNVKGMDYCYLATSERAGVMEVRYLAEEEIETSAFVSGATVMEALLELCSAENGTVGEPERLSATSVAYQIKW